VSRPGRFGLSIAASVALHAIGFAVMLFYRVPSRPAFVPIPVSLVGQPGGGGGARGDAPPGAELAPAPAPPPPAPAAPRPEPAVARRVVPSPTARRLARATPAPSPEPAVAPASTGGGDGASPGGLPGAGGGGDGSGGDGSGGARVAYGTNPLPPYPLLARRLGKEGVVVLEVLVATDGHAAEVRVVRSSGFAPLDESALTTVRDRWRFIPARRGGEPVESRVTVPIRFRLEDVTS
jgi:periplasmic protein TonB